MEGGREVLGLHGINVMGILLKFGLVYPMPDQRFYFRGEGDPYFQFY
jgi:hypothetical protein